MSESVNTKSKKDCMKITCDDEANLALGTTVDPRRGPIEVKMSNRAGR